MKPRILLVVPPQHIYPDGHGINICFPIGLLQIAACLRTDADVSILDASLTDEEIVFGIDAFMPKRAGLDDDTILREVESFAPDVVGVSCAFSSQLDMVLHTVELVRVAAPEALVVIGGAAATAQSHDILEKSSAIDVVVRGEGESALRKIARAYWPGCRRDVFPRIMSSEPFQHLDSLPLPAYDLLDLQEYVHNGSLYINRSQIPQNSMSVVTSRGCPYICSFCAVNAHMTRQYRAQSASYVLRHLQNLQEEHGFTGVHFEDDNFALDPTRFEELLDGMLNYELGLHWDTPNGTMALPHVVPQIEKAKAAGCARWYISIESASERVLRDVIRKPIRHEVVAELVHQCYAVKLPLSAYYVIGFPSETLTEMRTTVDLALHYLDAFDVWPHLMLATPLPGSFLFDECSRNGQIQQPLAPADYARATRASGHSLVISDLWSAADLAEVSSQFLAARQSLAAGASWNAPELPREEDVS